MEGSSQKSLRKGAWAEEEDILLRKCIMEYGEGKWRLVPLRAGLNRCRKSCRLRWLNYLQPNIIRGEFKPDEVDLIIRMHKLLGNRQVYQFKLLQELNVRDIWSLIAGRLPGRTANDIKNYYNTHLKKTGFSKYNSQVAMSKKSGHDNNAHRYGQDHYHRQNLQVLRPQPRTFKTSQWNMNKVTTPTGMNNNIIDTPAGLPDNSQVVYKNITECVPLLVDYHLEKFSHDQQIHTSNTQYWLKNILFGEAEADEEDSLSKKKQVTYNNNASLTSQGNTTKGVEEGMTKGKNDGSNDQPAYYCSVDDDKGLEEGGSAGDNENFWNSYLDDNLWLMLGAEQE
ncbi:hypothetical protein MKW98_019969 [Papaver atlanticum]|uniref:Uncharacterized protein n=1 Tax=Papaver atlanticum TaxID=357466 RepID=A0AAD4X612_9MAGN|nr:hypothetical protein MKW98_019969 [Papaver atlanticum]